MKKLVAGALVVVALLVAVWLIFGTRNVYEVDAPITADPSDCPADVRLAVIGDFGYAGEPEADVAALVDSWDVDAVVTVGDNNYPHGEAETIDENIGQYYQAYIHSYVGRFGPGASENRFYPALGNHDWDTGSIDAHLDYFTLPGNERYYDVGQGPVHAFILDSDPSEPDGRTWGSVQSDWLRERMAESTAPWKLVVLHHAPYTSILRRESDVEMRWPFAELGADAVLAGHDHVYERLEIDGIPYIVNGLGGKSIYRLGWPHDGSRVRYNQDYGAMLIQAGAGCMNVSFFNRGGELIDSTTRRK